MRLSPPAPAGPSASTPAQCAGAMLPLPVHHGNTPPCAGAANLGLPAETPVATQAVLAACIYIALRCPHCGEVRQARSDVPSTQSMPCPQCAIDCVYVFLGKGFTRRELPFSEVRRTELRLLPRRDEAPEIGSPIRGPSG